MDATMIAPCGMNCSLCMAYQREKNHCPGCRGQDEGKMKSCLSCIITKCEKRVGKDADFCYVCDIFPCTRIKNLDKRYRTKYNMSMLENIGYIEENGIDAFVKKEKKRWACDTCDGYICVHKGVCMACGTK